MVVFVIVISLQAVIAILLGVCSAAPHADPVPVAHAAPEPAAAPAAAPAPAPIPHPAPAIEAKSAAAIPEVKSAIQAPVPVAVSPIGEEQQPALIQSPVAAEHQLVPGIPSGKQLFIEAPLLKTPASTAKLTPLATPLITPVAPLTYAAAPAILAPVNYAYITV